MNLKKFSDVSHSHIPQECANCDDKVVQDLYMFLLTDKRTLILAGIPELLFWIIFCVCLLLCASLRLKIFFLSFG